MASKNPADAKALLETAAEKIFTQAQKMGQVDFLAVFGSACCAFAEGKRTMYENIMDPLLDVAGCTAIEKQAFMQEYSKQLQERLNAFTLEANKPKF